MLKELLDARFGGVLKKGSHNPNVDCCALELVSVSLGIPWTDSPNRTRTFDLRPINDIGVSDQIRTKHLLPVLEMYVGSLDWPEKRQKEVVSKLAVLTVQRIIGQLPDLSEKIREQCRQADTLQKAAAAAYAAYAYAYASASAANAAYAAASAYAVAYAAYAAHASAKAVTESIFIETCQIWLEAVQ